MQTSQKLKKQPRLNPVGPNIAFNNIKKELREIGLGKRGDWFQLTG
jgi:hypothetical protein